MLIMPPTRIPDLYQSGRKHIFPVIYKYTPPTSPVKHLEYARMDTAIDLSNPSKALDLDNIRFQLMWVSFLAPMGNG